MYYYANIPEDVPNDISIFEKYRENKVFKKNKIIKFLLDYYVRTMV